MDNPRTAYDRQDERYRKYETYEVVKMNQHALPDNALIGQWMSDDWRCVPYTSFCHRVYHVKEYQKSV